MTAGAGEIEIVEVSWQDAADRADLVRVRETVFVVEQGVPVEIELDDADAACRHVLARSPGGEPIGTARMRDDGHIGRIAVLSERRGEGIGARLVTAMVERAREAGLGAVDLDSQVQAISFYSKLGFEARGDVFMEAGIPHQNMVRALP